jgi:hypothetical protein
MCFALIENERKFMTRADNALVGGAPEKAMPWAKRVPALHVSQMG